jgi:ATP-dependent protease ClpP protease subunit
LGWTRSRKQGSGYASKLSQCGINFETEKETLQQQEICRAMRELDDIVNPVEPTAPSADAIQESIESIFGNWWQTQVINGVAHVHIFGEIGCTRPWKELLHEVCGAKDIKLFVDSPGGDSITGISLFNELTGRVSETAITGRCFSAALPIALSGKKIRIERNARILCHCPHSWIYADATQMRFTARHLDMTTAFIKKVIMERTELSETVVAGWLNGADVYFSAQQAVAYGLADEIFDQPKNEPCPVTVASVNLNNKAKCSTFTEDEQFFFDLLNALPRLSVNNRTNFLREVSAALFYNTDEIYDQK